MHWPRPKPIPLPIQCFIQRAEKERILPRGWALSPYGGPCTGWVVDILAGRSVVAHITLRSIEEDIVHCLDVLLPGIVARTKEQQS